MDKRFKKYGIGVIVFGMLCFYFTEALAMDLMNLLMPVVEKQYGWTRLMVNSAVATGSLFAIASGFVFGSLAMKFGINKVAGVTFLPIGLLAMLVGTTAKLEYFLFAVAGLQFLVGAGMLAATVFITNWFFQKRGLALGIVTLAMPVGSATFVPICMNLIMLYGKEPVFIVLGAVNILLGIISFFFMKNKPEDVGLSPDGIDRTPEEVEAMKAELEYKSDWTLGKLLRTKETWLVIIGNGCVFLMMTGIMSQFIPRLLDVGIPIQNALGIMSVSAIIGIPMSYFWGWVSDKIMATKVCAIFSLTYLLGSFFIANISPDSKVFMVLTIAFIANATGGMQSLMTNSIAYVYGRKDFVNVGRYIMVTRELFRSASFMVMGIIFSTFGTYTNAYYIFMGVALVGAVSFLAIRKSYDKERDSLPLNQGR